MEVEHPSDAVLDVGAATQAQSQPPSPAEPAGFTTHLPKLAGFAVLLLTAASLGACCKHAMSMS